MKGTKYIKKKSLGISYDGRQKSPYIIHEPLLYLVKAVLATRITWPNFLRPLFF